MKRRDFLKGSMIATAGLAASWGMRAEGQDAPGGAFDIVVYGASSADVFERDQL